MAKTRFKLDTLVRYQGDEGETTGVVAALVIRKDKTSYLVAQGDEEKELAESDILAGYREMTVRKAKDPNAPARARKSKGSQAQARA